MTDNKNTQQLAQELYEDGLSYNWRGIGSGENAALARAMFEQSAKLHHPKALRELAEMMFIGSGGAKEQERALYLKWQAARIGEVEALEELSALLESYAEDQIKSDDRSRAECSAKNAEQAHKLMSDLGAYVTDLSRLSHHSVGQA